MSSRGEAHLSTLYARSIHNLWCLPALLHAVGDKTGRTKRELETLT